MKIATRFKWNRAKITVAAVSLLAAFSLFASGSLVSPGKKSLRWNRVPTEVTSADTATDSVFLFFNGKYIPPPYTVRLRSDTTLSINGQRIDANELDLRNYERQSPCGIEIADQTREPSNPETPITLFHNDLSMMLRMHAVIVLEEESPPLIIGDVSDIETSIASLCDADDQRELNFHPAAAEATWNALVRKFQAPPAFRSHAKRYLEQLDHVHRAGITVITANLLVDAVGYPLHTFAMLMVVMAFGHLLSNKPCIELIGNDTQQHEHTRRVVTRSLILFGVLSAIDLFWTVASSQAGVLREMNPLGNALIRDPITLGVFKLAAVATTIALLVRLHASPVAQVASWWSCLVLTLLTARWLVFHSMLM